MKKQRFYVNRLSLIVGVLSTFVTVSSYADEGRNVPIQSTFVRLDGLKGDSDENPIEKAFQAITGYQQQKDCVDTDFQETSGQLSWGCGDKKEAVVSLHFQNGNAVNPMQAIDNLHCRVNVSVKDQNQKRLSSLSFSSKSDFLYSMNEVQVRDISNSNFVNLRTRLIQTTKDSSGKWSKTQELQVSCVVPKTDLSTSAQVRKAMKAAISKELGRPSLATAEPVDPDDLIAFLEGKPTAKEFAKQEQDREALSKLTDDVIKTLALESQESDVRYAKALKEAPLPSRKAIPYKTMAGEEMTKFPGMPIQ